MRHLKPEDIDTSARVRRQFDPEQLVALADSIESKGLLHPPVVRADNSLVAGERRLRAMQMLHEQKRTFMVDGVVVFPGQIPVMDIGELSPDLLLEAELEENILREGLTVQEEAAGYARLHELRIRQRGAYSKSANPEGQTVRKTADEIAGGKASGSMNTRVREGLTIAEHLEDPEVAKAKTRKDALRIIKQKTESELHKMLSERVGTRVHKDITIVHGSFELYEKASTIDCICTDPPYGIDAGSFGNQTAVDRAHTYADDYETWKRIMPLFAFRSFLVAKPRAHLYAMCAFQRYHALAGFLRAAGWAIWHRPLIWDKGSQGLLPDPEHGPRYVHDYILYAIKGHRPTTGVFDDIVRGAPQARNLRRAAEKPVELYANLIARSCRPGDVVWDPFCGTGGIIPAGRRLQCRVLAHDIDDEAIAIARRRAVEGDEE